MSHHETPQLASLLDLLEEQNAKLIQELRAARRAIAGALPQFELTDTQAAVIETVKQCWPEGRPSGKRKMIWYDEISAACLERGIYACRRTITEGLRRQELAKLARHSLPTTEGEEGING